MYTVLYSTIQIYIYIMNIKILYNIIVCDDKKYYTCYILYDTYYVRLNKFT